jgi:hypothetical protein
MDEVFLLRKIIIGPGLSVDSYTPPIHISTSGTNARPTLCLETYTSKFKLHIQRGINLPLSWMMIVLTGNDTIWINEKRSNLWSHIQSFII